ncbi:phage-related protein [Pseudomonas hunanensis]|uniref:Phage-related protein n=1 Tax=Pseudomonas hunanensis TaxID=1247546 RepID=A0ACC6K8T4_9PSED|nr:type II toxin-antitoxin system RelE/ParE family toxin [Pseudomonas hunanensis]MDR6714848.1 phage-related protein [Pseudomonas hunanensis]
MEASKRVKPVYWVGSSRKDLQALPPDIQDTFGFALHLAQEGSKHLQAKALKGFAGGGVLEVIEDHDGNTYRAVYTVRFSAGIYVLHCFQKKSKAGIKTPGHDIALVRTRLNFAKAHSEENKHE